MSLPPLRYQCPARPSRQFADLRTCQLRQARAKIDPRNRDLAACLDCPGPRDIVRELEANPQIRSLASGLGVAPAELARDFQRADYAPPAGDGPPAPILPCRPEVPSPAPSLVSRVAAVAALRAFTRGEVSREEVQSAARSAWAARDAREDKGTQEARAEATALLRRLLVKVEE